MEENQNFNQNFNQDFNQPVNQPVNQNYLILAIVATIFGYGVLLFGVKKVDKQNKIRLAQEAKKGDLGQSSPKVSEQINKDSNQKVTANSQTSQNSTKSN